MNRQEERWENKQRDKTLDLFTPRIKNEIELADKSEIHKCIKSLLKGKNIYLSGLTGSGKTILACATLLEIAKESFLEPQQAKFKSFAFISVPEFFEDLKATFKQDNKTKELLDSYKEVDLLILDDIGIDKCSEWVLSILYLLINYRYEFLKQTIYTCNLNKNELALKLTDDRIISRINNNSVSIKMKKIDFRIKV
jgi:DNA replication protein DnaC